jgi:hypothetical protein
MVLHPGRKAQVKYLQERGATNQTVARSVLVPKYRESRDQDK